MSIGWFDEVYLRECEVAVVQTPTGQISAFANVIPEYQLNEITIDLMRRRLHEFKEKFHPRWEPRYFIYPGVAALPEVVVALIRADSGDRLLDYFRPGAQENLENPIQASCNFSVQSQRVKGFTNQTFDSQCFILLNVQRIGLSR